MDENTEYVVFEVDPPYPVFEPHSVRSLGLDSDHMYTTAEASRAIGDHPDVVRKLILQGVYPEAIAVTARRRKLFSARQVVAMAEIRRRRMSGLPVRLIR